MSAVAGLIALGIVFGSIWFVIRHNSKVLQAAKDEEATVKQEVKSEVDKSLQ